MVTQEQVLSLIRELEHSQPKDFLQKVHHLGAGIGFVLHFLAHVQRPVSAGEISEHMGVSTARVAVLLRKLSDRNLITKQADPSDARRTLISLSPEGMTYVDGIRRDCLDMMTSVVQQVGVEPMRQYVRLSAQINDIITAELARRESAGGDVFLL